MCCELFLATVDFKTMKVWMKVYLYKSLGHFIYAYISGLYKF